MLKLFFLNRYGLIKFVLFLFFLYGLGQTLIDHFKFCNDWVFPQLGLVDY